MESYIRSKYETRRWAREGPPPQDPSVLDGEAPAAAAPPSAPPVQAAPSPTHTPRASVSSLNGVRNTQPQQHQLLSTALAASRQGAGSPASALAPPQRQNSQPQPVQQQQQPQQSAAVDLFSLDFHAPASTSPPPAQQQAQPQKDVKAEIMSLFSTATPATAAAPQQNAFGGAGMFGAAPAQAQNQFGGLGAMGGAAGMGGMGAAAQANPWGGFGQQPQAQQPQQTSMMGNAGVGMWGASSGWNAGPAPAAPGQSIWSTPAPASQQSLFSTSDVWGAPAASNSTATGTTAQKNNDAFGDLWGGFK